MVFLVVNTASMASRVYPISNTHDYVLNLINQVVAVVFTLEMIIKVIGLGPERYADSRWNIFDGLITVASLGAFLSGSAIGSVLHILRLLRVLRILRMARQIESLKRAAETLLLTGPTLLTIGGLLVFVMMVFAIVGMQFFYNIALDGDNLDSRHANFRTFFNTFVLLFRCLTGENWNGVMHESGAACAQDCTPDAQGQCSGCYGPVVAQIYWYLFFIICMSLLINLVLPVIIDGYIKTGEQNFSNNQLTPEMVDHFSEVWAEFDPRATGTIRVRQLRGLIARINHPLGVKKPADTEVEVSSLQSKVAQLVGQLSRDVLRPTKDNKLRFKEVLVALTIRLTCHDLANNARRSELAKQAYELWTTGHEHHEIADDPLGLSTAGESLPSIAEQDAAYLLLKAFRRHMNAKSVVVDTILKETNLEGRQNHVLNQCTFAQLPTALLSGEQLAAT
jgi:hypothetical protein